MKIPTLLGITLIVTLVALGGLYYYYAPQQTTLESDVQITDLEVVNVSNNSATIIWQTSFPVVGEVIFGESEDLNQTGSDNRDRGLKRDRLVHFATLNNLKENTRYFYKIRNNNQAFPTKALEFRTGSMQLTEEESLSSFPKPLKGTILNTNLNPIEESLILVDIPGATRLATFSSTAGNFILPLRTVLNSELNRLFVIAPDTLGKLTVTRGEAKSEVKIKISEKTINLPPIPIGSNLDLEKFEMQPINKITFSTVPAIGGDFNGDQKVNSLDLALLKEAAESGTNTQSNFDFNRDGLVDQDDVVEFSKTLDGN